MFPEDTHITNQYLAQGVSFSPNLYYNSQSTLSGVVGITGNYLGNNPSDVFNPNSILFSTAQTSMAFAFATNATNTTFTAKLNGNVVDSATIATTYNLASQVYVVFTGQLFDEIEFSVENGPGLVDNIQFGDAAGVVPEPFTMSLLGMAAYAAYRKKRKAA